MTLSGHYNHRRLLNHDHIAERLFAVAASRAVASRFCYEWTVLNYFSAWRVILNSPLHAFTEKSGIPHRKAPGTSQILSLYQMTRSEYWAVLKTVQDRLPAVNHIH